MRRAFWLLAGAALVMSSCAKHTDAISTVQKQAIEVVWQTDVDNRKPRDAESYARPMVSGLLPEAHIAMGGHDARIHVMNMSGHEIYRAPLNDNSDSGGVALPNGLLVVGDTGGMLYAFDAVKEQRIWSIQLSAGITGTPVVVGRDVLVQTIDDHLYRISEDGKKQWVFSAKPETLGLYISPTPLLKDDRIYTVLGNGDALALDAITGDLLWRKQLLLDDRAGALSNMRVPSATPLLLKKFKIDGNSFSDVLLIPFYQGDLFILSREDGASLMTRKMSLKSSPAVDGAHMFLADTHGEVQAWDIQTGVMLWHRTLSKGELMGPVLWHKQLWVHDNKGQLFRLNQDGDLLDSREFPGRFDRLPVVTLDGLLYHSSLGGLYMVR